MLQAIKSFKVSTASMMDETYIASIVNSKSNYLDQGPLKMLASYPSEGGYLLDRGIAIRRGLSMGVNLQKFGQAGNNIIYSLVSYRRPPCLIISRTFSTQ